VGRPELQRLAATLQFTVLGAPVIYYGDEVGRAGGEWPYNRPSMPPESLWDRGTFEHYSRLCALRRRHVALSRGAHRTLHASGDVIAFLRWWEEPGGGIGDAVLVAVNRGDTPVEISFPLPPELTRSAPLRDAPGSAGPVRLGARVILTVPPLGARILASSG